MVRGRKLNLVPSIDLPISARLELSPPSDGFGLGPPLNGATRGFTISKGGLRTPRGFPGGDITSQLTSSPTNFGNLNSLTDSFQLENNGTQVTNTSPSVRTTEAFNGDPVQLTNTIPPENTILPFEVVLPPTGVTPIGNTPIGVVAGGDTVTPIGDTGAPGEVTPSTICSPFEFCLSLCLDADDFGEGEVDSGADLGVDGVNTNIPENERSETVLRNNVLNGDIQAAAEGIASIDIMTGGFGLRVYTDAQRPVRTMNRNEDPDVIAFKALATAALDLTNANKTANAVAISFMESCDCNSFVSEEYAAIIDTFARAFSDRVFLKQAIATNVSTVSALEGG
eukprot:g3798.t1